jgi:PAS domain-containing protein
MEERRQVEWRLQEHQLFLSTVLNGIQAGIFVFDPAQGRMVSSNSVAQALTHLSEEEISSGSCSQGQVGFVAGGRAMNLLCPDWSEQDSFLEGLVHLPDGRSFPASRQLMEIIIDGQAHLVQIVFDITERKNLERRLGMAQKLESIGLLAAGIAHEINTPVQYVGDSVRFVRDAFADLFGLLSAYAGLRARAAEGAPAGEDLRRVDEAVVPIKYCLQDGLVAGLKKSLGMMDIGLALMKAKRMKPKMFIPPNIFIPGVHKIKGVKQLQRMLDKAAAIDAAKEA